MAINDIKISQLTLQELADLTDDTIFVTVDTNGVNRKVTLNAIKQYAVDSIVKVYRTDAQSGFANLPETFTTIAELNTGESYPAGKYMIAYSFTADYDVVNKSIVHQFSFNGNPFEVFSKEVKDATDVITDDYYFPINHTADGAITFTLQARKDDPAGILNVPFANVILEYKDKLDIP